MNTAEIDLALAQARLEAIRDVLEVRSNANGRMYVARPTCLKVLDYWTRRVAELEAQTETPPQMRVAACKRCGVSRLTSWAYCMDCKRILKAEGKRKEALRRAGDAK